MIQITPHMRILLAVELVDFRKGIDGLAALCRQSLSSDPQACDCVYSDAFYALPVARRQVAVSGNP